MFNRGYTGMGNNPQLFTQTWAPERVVAWFTSRGWLVAFPQRRGRGGSDGLYDVAHSRKNFDAFPAAGGRVSSMPMRSRRV